MSKKRVLPIYCDAIYVDGQDRTHYLLSHGGRPKGQYHGVRWLRVGYTEEIECIFTWRDGVLKSKEQVAEAIHLGMLHIWHVKV